MSASASRLACSCLWSPDAGVRELAQELLRIAAADRKSWLSAQLETVQFIKPPALGRGRDQIRVSFRVSVVAHAVSVGGEPRAAAPILGSARAINRLSKPFDP